MSMTKVMTIHEHLLSVGIGPEKWEACKEVREWASQYKTAQEVWDNCERVDWLFWWSARMGQYKSVAEAAKEIAESVSHLRSGYAATYAAAAAIYAAAADAAAAATYAAAAATYAADAADAATYAAAAAIYAATYAADAATYAAAAVRKQQRQKNLEIARKHLVCPWHEEKEQISEKVR